MTRSPRTYLIAAVLGFATALLLATLVPGYGRADGPVLLVLGPEAGIHLLDVVLSIALAGLAMGVVHRFGDKGRRQRSSGHA